jgi:hypothetical protein
MQDVVDFKEAQPREMWLQTLAWQLLEQGNNDIAVGRVWANREFVRERIINHIQYVRPTIRAHIELAKDDKWQQLSEMVIQLVDAGRCSWTHKDWQGVLDAHGDKPTTAPFFTRIPWSCVANFQLAPNVRTLGSHIIKTEPAEGVTPVDAAVVAVQAPVLGNILTGGLGSQIPVLSEMTDADREAEEASCMADAEQLVALGLPDAAAVAVAAPGSPEAIRASKRAAAVLLHADVKRKPPAKLTDEQKDQIYAISQQLQPRKTVWQVNEVAEVLSHANFPRVENGWDANQRQHRKSFAQIINKIVGDRSKAAKEEART